jgi:hypothetical protein
MTAKTFVDTNVFVYHLDCREPDKQRAQPELREQCSLLQSGCGIQLDAGSSAVLFSIFRR